MNNSIPIQKVSSSSKTKKWFRDNVIYGVQAVLQEKNSIKPDIANIIENYKLYNGERNFDDMKKSFDPISSLSPQYKPVFEAFSTIADRINELVGEYIERGTEYVIAALDREAVNKKVNEDRDRINMEMMKIINDPNIEDKESIKERIENIVDFKFQSKSEVTANRVLDFYKKTNRLKYKEVEGFRNALITAVTCFTVDIINNRLEIELHSSDEVFAIRNGNSNDLKDSEIFAIVKYLPRGRIIDKYREYLSKSDIDRIISDSFVSLGTASEESSKQLVFESIEQLNDFTNSLDRPNYPYSTVDNNNNIRVVELKWKGYRKAYKRKYYDDLGKVQYDYVSEFAKADVNSGEVFTETWFVEWHKGTLIGSDIVVNASICDYQYRNVSNPNINIPGFVGGYFNVGNNKAKSLIDLVKPYLYFRDELFARIRDLLSKNMGKILELDLDRKPSTWSVEKMLYYIKRYNIKIVSSFNEGTKGASKGKIAGQYQQSSRILDAELGVSIGYIINLLSLVDSMISRATGVSDQRLGNIHNRELVGNVERSYIQSSMITEIWFYRYEQIILDLYETIIEVSKRAVKVDDRLQYVLDDFSYAILNSSLSDFKNTDFGLFPVNVKRYDKLKNILEQMAMSAVPNGNMSIEQFISLYDSNSVPEMIDKQLTIAKENEKAKERVQKAREEARLNEIRLTMKLEEYNKGIEDKFNKELAKLKGDYSLMIESMKIQDKALSEQIRSMLETNSKKIEQDFNNKKLELETELKKQFASEV